jgi:hypothetical protein
MMQTNHISREAAKDGKLETATGICPACSSLTEFSYAGIIKTPKNDETFEGYSCGVCSSIINSEYMKWKKK